MLPDKIAKHGSNLLKTGFLFALSNITSQAVRNNGKDTLQAITQDFRKFKNNMHTNYLDT
jgi:hypothetical protein